MAVAGRARETCSWFLARGVTSLLSFFKKNSPPNILTIPPSNNLNTHILREELTSIQSSYIRDNSTNNLYKMPSKMSDLSKKIYDALELKRENSVRTIQ